MRSFGQIASGHVHLFFIIELLQIKGNEGSTKLKISQQIECKWNSSANVFPILN
jgi:hypothetical protein